MNMVRITCNILYCNIIDQNQYQNILQLQLKYIYIRIYVYMTLVAHVYVTMNIL